MTKFKFIGTDDERTQVAHITRKKLQVGYEIAYQLRRIADILSKEK